MDSTTNRRAITKFSKHFLPELRTEITSHLDLDDLKRYSLCCAAFHHDASHYMWTSIRLSPTNNEVSGERLSHFSSFLLDSPQRAASVRSLSITIYDLSSPSEDRWRVIPSEPEDPASFWARVQRAFALLSGLQRLELDFESPSPFDQSSLQEISSVLLSAPLRDTLSTLRYLGPPSRLVPFLEAWPNIVGIRTGSVDRFSPETPDVDTGSGALSRVTALYGDTNLLASVSRGAGAAGLTTFIHNQARLREHNAIALGDVARKCQGLKALSLSYNTEYMADEPDSLLESIAHPTVEALEIFVRLDYQGDSGFDTHYLLMFLQNDVLLRSFPSLKFLHIVLYHADFACFITMDPNSVPWDVEAIEINTEALKSFLDAEPFSSALSLERVWIDCGSRHEHASSDSCIKHALRFRADKVEEKWMVDAQRCQYNERLIMFPNQ
ncbi:hypothetical protein DL93DRAFT_2091564 [Clavulina sp. PMI_390]|nr:hypothetical protein DL93DRAFT_2091564 [Clavulina sp. PMI_390]